MKKIIFGVLVFFLLLVTALSATAHSSFYGTYQNSHGNYYDQSPVQNIPHQNPNFESYYDFYGKDQKYDRAYATWRYQQAVSPYVIAQSPYGKKPWAKPYGDNPINTRLTSSYPRSTLTKHTYTGTYKPSPYSKPMTYTTSFNTRNYWQPNQLPISTNPFYGSLYTRGYHCHNADACHYHNVFPDSDI